ncbi:hypothetical protein Vadar_012999 [Vaccinium darrowii]|uniref:Uncharacterized protein n=1 Tax=Vaccinium darrowii TaxID=229202 RepID=A0ACB7YV28_9ERIC|nr:hypothetical protein Vadar_012999 [Vaccinium darrowii]
MDLLRLCYVASCNTKDKRLTKLENKRWIAQITSNFMDFEVDDDINGEVLGNSVDVEGRYNENGMGGCSVDVTCDLSGRGMLPGGELQPVNSSTPVDEPYIGQEFESEAEAHAFYNAYATRVGFIIRVSKLSRSRRDGSTIGRALVCNREGFRIADKREKIEHTHPLSPGKGRRDLIYEQYPNEHDKVRELSQQLAIERKRTATYKRHLEMIFEHIEDHNQSLAKKIQGVVDSVKEMESKEQQSQR